MRVSGARSRRLEGDHNGKLDALQGREWDAVIDNPSTLPRWVRDAATLLKDSRKAAKCWRRAIRTIPCSSLTRAIKKALAAGLTFRSLADAATATLAYHESRDAERKAKFLAGIKPEREAEVLAAWRRERKK